MPLYEYGCEEDGKAKTVWRHVEQRDQAPVCSCGRPMKRAQSLPSLSFSGLGFTRGYVPAGKKQEATSG